MSIEANKFRIQIKKLQRMARYHSMMPSEILSEYSGFDDLIINNEN